MAQTTPVLEKLRRLETLISRNKGDKVMELTIKKLFEIERKTCKAELSRLKRKMRKFEREYKMDSEGFMAKWEKGKLNDKESYFVWSSLCSMYKKTHEKLNALEE
ncbi:hypothetical protein LR066_03950 [candidate division WOR-3 bacterium]|nr:hypothetical protein [candidate division WOR-3 bacterium]